MIVCGRRFYTSCLNNKKKKSIRFGLLIYERLSIPQVFAFHLYCFRVGRKNTMDMRLLEVYPNELKFTCKSLHKPKQIKFFSCLFIVSYAFLDSLIVSLLFNYWTMIKFNSRYEYLLLTFDFFDLTDLKRQSRYQLYR